MAITRLSVEETDAAMRAAIQSAGGEISHVDMVERLNTAGVTDIGRKLLAAVSRNVIAHKMDYAPQGKPVLRYVEGSKS